MLKNFILFLYLILSIGLDLCKRFDYSNYDLLFNRIEFLAMNCSRYIQIDTSQQRYGLDAVEPCMKNGSNTTCDTPIIYMTDFATYNNKRTQVHISGLLHGDEVLGPIAVMEFIEYFCQEQKANDSFEFNILKERLFIITPFTNSYGYSHSIREDKIIYRENKTHSFVDPNRDFPYNTNDKDYIEDCMQSITARTLNEIFKEHIIVSSVSFHGGIHAIGYPWGNKVHLLKDTSKEKSTESPDYNAFITIAGILANYSESKENNDNGITKYPISDMSEIVGYSVENGMEDWAYAGSWENKVKIEGYNNTKPIKQCEPITFNEYKNKTTYDDISLRAMVLLVETSDEKNPSKTKLGFDDNFEGINDTIFNRNHSFYGHIIKNMRIIWSTADLISAYFYLDHHSLNLSDYTLYFNTTLSGCQTIENITQYQLHIDNKQILTFDTLSNLELLEGKTFISQTLNKTNCYWNDDQPLNFTLNIDKSFFIKTPSPKARQKFPKTILTYLKGHSPDIFYALQTNPDPEVLSQTHLVNHKHNLSYSVSNANYKLAQNNIFYSHPIAIREDGTVFIIDSIESYFYNGNDMSLAFSLYSSYDDFAFNKTKMTPFVHISPNTINNHSRISELTYNISLGIFLTTSDYSNNDAMFFIDKDDAFLLFYSSNDPFEAEIILNEDNDTIQKFHCVFYQTIIKKYYILCHNIFENITGVNMTLDIIREKVLNSYMKMEIMSLNFTLYGMFTMTNEKYMGKKDDIMERNNQLLCYSNPSINSQIIYLDSQNISTSNLTARYYDKDMHNYKITMVKMSNYHYKVSLNITNYDSLSKNGSDIYALVFPFHDLFLAGNLTSLQNVDLYLNQSLTNTRLIGKAIQIIQLGNDMPLANITSLFLRQIINHRIQKEYKISLCSIDNNPREFKETMLSFFNTHTKPKFKISQKAVITISAVTVGVIIFIIVSICLIIFFIRRYNRRGYATLSTKRIQNVEQF